MKILSLRNAIGMAAFIIILYFLASWLGYRDFIFLLEAHGSLISGVMAVAGVAWMVHTQKVETAKVIKSNEDVMRNEAFEIKKAKAIDSLLLLRQKYHEINKSFKNKHCFSRDDSDKFRYDLGELTLYLGYFFRGRAKGLAYLKVLYTYREYLLVVNPNLPYFSNRMLNAFNSLDVSLERDRKLFYAHIDMESPQAVLDNRAKYSTDEVNRYILKYINEVVFRELEDVIEKERL